MITKQYLRDNPHIIFVFGDNTDRKGKGGSASLRDEPNTYGFITKKHPNRAIQSYYTPSQYEPIYRREIVKLKGVIRVRPDKQFYISNIGGGLANKFGISEKIIIPNIFDDLNEFENVVFLSPLNRENKG